MNRISFNDVPVIKTILTRLGLIEPRFADVESAQAVSVANSASAVALANQALAMAGAASYTDEQARDAVGAALRGGDGLGIAINDPADTITVGINTPATVANRLGLGSLAYVTANVAAGSTVTGSNTGDQLNVTGNAGTATRLATSRTINGVFFDGTANITINATDSVSRQPLDDDLTAIASLTTTTFGRNFLTYADAPATRAALSLGSAALVNTGSTVGTVPLIGSDNKLSAAIMPAIAITDVFEVASQAEMLALTAQRGDVAIRTDINNTYILATEDPTILANWKEVRKPAGGGGGGTVTSVSVVTANGVSGAVANSATTPAITLTLGAITPTSVAASGNITGANLSGTNTGDQTITLTGDVTGSGTGSFAATIGNGVVTLAKQANVATGTVFYRKTAGSGAPEVQPLPTLKSDLGLSVATDALGALTPAADRVPYFTSGTAAAVTTLTGYGRTLIALTDAAALTAQINVVSTTAKGAVPQLPGNTTTFLRGDGTFAAPTASTSFREQTLSSTTDGAIHYARYHARVAQTITWLVLAGSQPANIAKLATNGQMTAINSSASAGATGSVSLAAGEALQIYNQTGGLGDSSYVHVNQTA